MIRNRRINLLFINRIRNDLYDHGGDALAEDAQQAGGFPREVDDATTAEGATVVDADNDDTVVGGIGDTQTRAEGMGAMGTGEAVVMKALTTAGEAARGPLAIVGSNALLHVLGMQKKRRKSEK